MKVELEWHHRSKIAALARIEISNIEEGKTFYLDNDEELTTLREILELMED